MVVLRTRGGQGTRPGSAVPIVQLRKPAARRWQTDTLDLKPDTLGILVGVKDPGAGRAEQYERQYDRLPAGTSKALPEVRLGLGEPFGLPLK